MRYPSKVTTYKESSIAVFPIVLGYLEAQDLTPSELFKKVRNKVSGIQEFSDILDCLYALNKIELVGEDIHYVS